MATTTVNEDIYAAVERELERVSYPGDFPALPDMPASRYIDPVYYDLEVQHVFKKTWLNVGHVSELPKPGAYKLWEQLDESIIVSRGTDDVIRAFKNTCRHRGAALVTKPTGVAKRFVCPYHSWGYSSEGELKSVPEAHNFACLNKAERPLFQVRCEIWRGFIFINFDTDAIPLAEFMAPLDAQVGDFPLEKMAVKGVLRTELDCNWKTAYDNFLEIYHVSSVHRETIAPFLDSKSFVVSPLDHGHARFTTRKKIEGLYGSGAMDDLDERYKNLTVAFPRFPNGFTALDPAGFNWMAFWPAGPDKMVIVSTMMGMTKDDPEEDRAYWEEFTAYQGKILDEDVNLFPTVQRSMRKGDLTHLVLSYQEQYIQWYHEHLDTAIGIDNIPGHLRVDPVMTRSLGR